MTYQYSYKELLSRAQRVTWQVDDLIGGEKKLDFSKPFMPEGLARTEKLSFLDGTEKRTLNQIRGHAYLSIFGLVEEFILPFVMDRARSLVHGDSFQERALLEFAGEEAKHIHLFRRFREEFVAGFGVPCEVIGPPAAVAAHVLSHPALSVALLTLHIEWMVHRHFQESVEEDVTLDPQFKNLLLHHWMEELQHAHLDAMMVAAIAKELSATEIEAGVQGYVALGGFLDEGLKQQVTFDLAAFECASGRRLDGEARAEFTAVQHQANRWTYIGSGMTHPNFLESLGAISPSGRRMIEDAAPAFV